MRDGLADFERAQIRRAAREASLMFGSSAARVDRRGPRRQREVERRRIVQALRIREVRRRHVHEHVVVDEPAVRVLARGALVFRAAS